MNPSPRRGPEGLPEMGFTQSLGGPEGGLAGQDLRTERDSPSPVLLQSLGRSHTDPLLLGP